MLSTLELIQLEDLATKLAKENKDDDELLRDYHIEMTEELYETDFGI